MRQMSYQATADLLMDFPGHEIVEDYQRQRQQHNQQPCQHQDNRGSGCMFQIGFAIDHVRDAKKHQIHSHAPHNITHGQVGPGIYRRAKGRGKVRQRSHTRQQQDPNQCLAHAGTIRQLISQSRQSAACGYDD